MRCPKPTTAAILRRIAMCLALGAVCTFVVAAGRALYAPLGSPSFVTRSATFTARPGPPSPQPPTLRYPFAVPDTWPRRPASRHLIESWGFRIDAWHASGAGASGVGDVSAAVYRSGWPMLAMQRHQVRETRGQINRDRWAVAGAGGGLYPGLAVPQPLRPLLPPQTRPFRHRIPLAPIPAGFALNTALAAALLYPVLYGRGHLLRARRRATGRCLVCGYDARPLPICPECGERVEDAGKPDPAPAGAGA